jgi:hypothetical protein
LQCIYKNIQLYINIQSVPRSKHTLDSVATINQLVLYREIIVVCCEIHTKHINALCGQNVELLNVKTGDTYSDRWAVKGHGKAENVIEKETKHGYTLTSNSWFLQAKVTLHYKRVVHNYNHYFYFKY